VVVRMAEETGTEAIGPFRVLNLGHELTRNAIAEFRERHGIELAPDRN
jgi:hypothetical protein